MTCVGLLILKMLGYFQLLSLCTLINSILLYFSIFLMFQTCMMHKEAHHPSILEILLGRLQVLLVWTWIECGGEITCHARVWTPAVKVITLLDTWFYQFVLVWDSLIRLWRVIRGKYNTTNIYHIPWYEELPSCCHFFPSQESNDPPDNGGVLKKGWHTCNCLEFKTRLKQSFVCFLWQKSQEMESLHNTGSKIIFMTILVYIMMIETTTDILDERYM